MAYFDASKLDHNAIYNIEIGPRIPSITVLQEKSYVLLGYTYPRRAKQLIKKGRAFWHPQNGEIRRILMLKKEANK